MRSLRLLVVFAAAVAALGFGGTALAAAKGRQYHTIISSHRFKLQACYDAAQSLMYLRTDARHNRGYTRITYTDRGPSSVRGSGEFSSVPGHLTNVGGQTVDPDSTVRFRVKLPGIKRVRVKSVLAPQLGGC